MVCQVKCTWLVHMQAKISAAVSASHHRRNALKKAHQALQSEASLQPGCDMFACSCAGHTTCRLEWGQCSHNVAHHHSMCWQCLPVLHVAHAQQPLHSSFADVSVRFCTRCTVGHAQHSMVMQGSSNQEPGLSSVSSSKTDTQELPSQVARPPRVKRNAAKKAAAEKFVNFDGIKDADSQDRRSTGR